MIRKKVVNNKKYECEVSTDFYRFKSFLKKLRMYIEYELKTTHKKTIYSIRSRKITSVMDF